MSVGIRKWDLYVLEDMGCSQPTIDVFLETHDEKGNVNPKFGLWVDHCRLLGIHPFFAGTKMPVTEEGLQNLWLAERDLLLMTVRKFGKRWWKDFPDDYKLYKAFSKELRARVRSIPRDVVLRFESRKNGYRSMDEPVFYNRNSREMIRSVRLDMNKLYRVFAEARLPVKSFDPAVLSVPARKALLRRPGDGQSLRDGGSLKKSLGLFSAGGPAAPDVPLGPLPGSLSWGRDRMPGFGDDIHELVFFPDGRPCPTVRDWFYWCRCEDVNPLFRGFDYPSSPGGLLQAARFERKAVEFSSALWYGYNAESVLMDAAVAYDRKFPVRDRSRLHGKLHVGAYLSGLDRFSFGVDSVSERMDSFIDRIPGVRCNMLTRKVASLVRKEAERIFETGGEDNFMHGWDGLSKSRRGIQL